eukprot:GHVR01067396.1.p1 GENE.GHVR01067396.1~~GHVR01067396.1.p1  ORF type:complete len:108 (+),score=4.48 GHVR01067396.1:84-407(+)
MFLYAIGSLPLIRKTSVHPALRKTSVHPALQTPSITSTCYADDAAALLEGKFEALLEGKFEALLEWFQSLSVEGTKVGYNPQPQKTHLILHPPDPTPSSLPRSHKNL